ncbi:hypothetical protein OG21DRAFT_1520756 [Imleria badia]|nr:hypothetical protein OG21DRAFT_1520756 [Imleria badia]
MFSVLWAYTQNLCRLGVGASIPTAPPLAHEASKLKRRLGKNGARNDSVVELQSQGSSKLDDEEHKGRPTKRKTQADPFGHQGSKKKRKAGSTANLDPPAENVSKQSVSPLKIPASGELAKHGSSSGKEKQQLGPGDQQSHVAEGQRSMVTLASSPPVRLPVQTPSLTAHTVPSLSEPSRETSGALRILHLLSTHLPHSSLARFREPKTPESSRVHTNFTDKAKPLGIPLLNLDGPPELTDNPRNISELNNSRKNRKRRKKKKHQTVAGTRDN